MEDIISKLKISTNGNNKIIGILKNIDKNLSLKYLRFICQKMTTDYEFMDRDIPIEQEYEKDYLIEDLLFDNKIYIRKIPENTENKKRVINTDNNKINENAKKWDEQNFNKINQLNQEILILKKNLENEKNENKKLNNKIKELEELLKIEKEKNLKIIDNSDINNNKKILELFDDLRIKDKEIKELKELNSRYPFVLEKNEKIMSVIFISVDQKVHFSIICKNTDLFTRI